MERAYSLASELSVRGLRIISGGALGIDAAAHAGAVSVSGHTIAVMACGLDQYYPRRNQRLFEQILEVGGAIVSPFAQGAAPIAWRFVRRNRIIAALADLVIVVEANTNSGSLHTARFGVELGRKVAVVPGSPGCEALRAAGIPAIQNAAEAEDVRAGTGPVAQVTLPAEGTLAAQVLPRLDVRSPATAATLQANIGLPLREVQTVLLQLHLDLLVVALPGQRYLRSPLADLAMTL